MDVSLSFPHLEAWQALALILTLIGLSALSIRLPVKPHRLLMIGLSICFIAWADAFSGILLLVYAHVAYYLLSRHANNPTLLRRSAWGSIAALLSLKFAQVYGTALPVHGFLYLLGISYYVFRIASSLFDTAKTGKFHGDYLGYLTYCLFFPIFTGGPVERYEHFKRADEPWLDSCQIGLKRMMFGVLKKLFLADVMLLSLCKWLLVVGGIVASPAQADPVGQDSLAFNYLGLLPAPLCMFLFGAISILRAYIDLSAFTDLAVGGSRLLGYRVAENFNRPLLATNLIDFWRRWHMTIAGWARDYIFSPLMVSTRRVALSVILTMLFMGMWHAPSLAWFIWGMGHGIGMVVCGWWQRTKLHHHLNFYRDPDFLADRTRLRRPVVTGLTAVFNTLAWAVLFGYMSVIFIFVSAPNLDTAMHMLKILFLMET